MSNRTKVIKIEGRGRSMLPLIREGDLVHVEKFEKEIRLVPGDVVVFLFRRQLLCHRLMWLGEGWAITKGDNSWRGEKVRPLNRIIGKVIKVSGKSRERDFRRKSMRIVGYALFMRSFAVFVAMEIIFRTANRVNGFRRHLHRSVF